MGRKGKNSWLEQRKLCVQLYLKGEKYKKIYELLNIKSNTVGDLVRRFRNEGMPQLSKKGGQKYWRLEKNMAF